jgi:hypothetical protein
MDRANRRSRSHGKRCVATLQHRQDRLRPSRSPRCQECRRNPKAAGILRIRARGTSRCARRPARRRFVRALCEAPAARSCQCWPKHQRNPRAAGIQANARDGGTARRQAPAAQKSILTLCEAARLKTPKEPKNRRNPGESSMVPGRTNPPNRSGEGVGTRPAMKDQAARWSKRAGGCDQTLTLGHSMGVSRAVISDVIGRRIVSTPLETPADPARELSLRVPQRGDVSTRK